MDHKDEMKKFSMLVENKLTKVNEDEDQEETATNKLEKYLKVESSAGEKFSTKVDKVYDTAMKKVEDIYKNILYDIASALRDLFGEVLNGASITFQPKPGNGGGVKFISKYTCRFSNDELSELLKLRGIKAHNSSNGLYFKPNYPNSDFYELTIESGNLVVITSLKYEFGNRLRSRNW